MRSYKYFCGINGLMDPMVYSVVYSIKVYNGYFNRRLVFDPRDPFYFKEGNIERFYIYKANIFTNGEQF